MNAPEREEPMPRAANAQVTADTVTVELDDGRTVSVPLSWYPRLVHGRREERQHWRLIADGEGVHWPDLDEDISVANLLVGKPSGESQRSFKRWPKGRQSGAAEAT